MNALDRLYDLLSPAACAQEVCRWLHPSGVWVCPACGERLDGWQAYRFVAGRRLRCRGCRAWFTRTTGTPVSGTQACDDRRLVLFVALREAGCMISDIALACRVSEDTVRRWMRRL